MINSYKYIKNNVLSCALFVLLLSGFSVQAQPATELRGVWLAWAGANVPSKERIAQIMDKLADANFNAVFVDVWRYGYPYFRSETFFNLTGKYTDPAIENGRDILEEFIAEGHRRGLHVEAWFEHGFVAGQGGNDDLYDVHPEWFARKRDGSVLFNGNLQFKWLSHVNADAQQFLIDMVQEVIENYDVDGVELDRIRYPELNCGYDSATVAVYQSEHGGANPPNNSADPGWMQWRADKLSAFMDACYDSFKAVNPNIVVSNAPIVYPYGYSNFCQDWRPWINDGNLDFVTPQVYRLTASQYASELNLQLAHVNDPATFYPGITTVANDADVTTGDLIQMIEYTRFKNLNGHVVWFVDTVEDDLDSLKNTVYSQPAEYPLLPENWRRPAIIINEDDHSVQRSSGWTVYTTIPGFDGRSLFTIGGTGEYIEYSADIPESGWYELYHFNITQFNGMQSAPFEVFDKFGTDTVYVDQTREGHRRWYKIADVYLQAGQNQLVMRLTDEFIGTNVLFADAIMLLNSNRAGLPVVGIDEKDAGIPGEIELFQNYPNPFNPTTEIKFSLNSAANVRLSIFNILGQEIAVLANEKLPAGVYSRRWDARKFASGVYFYVLKSGNATQSKKMVLMR